MKILNMEKYHIKNGVYVYTNDNHVFGTDAILLADFSLPKSNYKAIDLGSGCGIIPLVWRARGITGDITALDISEEACELVKTANENNPKDANIKVICVDLRKIKGVLPLGEFDSVTMNPPYKAANDGIISPNEAIARANHELFCTMDDIAYTASKLLKFGGRLTVCQRPSRLCDVITTMKKYNIEPKRLRFVEHRVGKGPSLFLLEGRFGSLPSLSVEPTLFIKDEHGNNTPEMQKILNDSYQKESSVDKS